jgi:hypothetical protein
MFPFTKVESIVFEKTKPSNGDQPHLYNKDVSKYVEVKGSGRYQASYLSWAFALKVLKENYPEAYTETVFYSGIPYLKTEVGYFVTTRIYLSLEDRKNSLGYDYTFPVLDNTYKAIKNPDVFHINTSIQRCLVKNIAMFGLGLSLYYGEDLPSVKELKNEISKAQQVNTTATNALQQLKDNAVKDLTKLLKEIIKRWSEISKNYEKIGKM